MKKFFVLTGLFLALAVVSCNAPAESSSAPAPDKLTVLKEILKERKTIRQFDTTRTVSDEVIMDILWAANGVNREDGKRTAPSAVNMQDIELYVCKAEGTYHYVPATEALEQVSGSDIRPLFAGRNASALVNPVILLVSNKAKFEKFGEEAAARFSAMDAGYVSQNIYMYCSAAGMATVACAGGVNPKAIQEALGLPEGMVALLYHPIGYPAK